MIGIERRELGYPDGVLISELIKDFTVVDMRYGDYLIRGNKLSVGLERVTNSGLLNDLNTARMIDKLNGCAKDFDAVILLIEGLILPSKNGRCLISAKNSFRYFNLNSSYPGFRLGAQFMSEMREYNFNYNRLAEFLTSASLRWLDKIEWTIGPRDTAERILSLHKYFNKTEHELHLVKPRPFSSLTREKRTAELMLSEIPGVGIDRAGALIKHFGNAYSVVNATVKELSLVDGIGRVTANAIYEECRRKYV